MDIENTESKNRFTGRVGDYRRHRPSYPQALLDWLQEQQGLNHGDKVADIACGTGLLAELFLRNGCRVVGVEPNAEMRAAAENELGIDQASQSTAPRNSRGVSPWEFQAEFKCLPGSAEDTGLAAGGVQWISVGQAFHWFDLSETRREFQRILAQGGQCVLVWNERVMQGSSLMADYEALLLEHALDYRVVRYRNLEPETIAGFFAEGPIMAEFPNAQEMDYAALKGRLRSSSYSPPPEHPGHAPMLAALEALFNRHAEGGVVRFQYITRVYCGGL